GSDATVLFLFAVLGVHRRESSGPLLLVPATGPRADVRTPDRRVFPGRLRHVVVRTIDVRAACLPARPRLRGARRGPLLLARLDRALARPPRGRRGRLELVRRS